MTSSRLLPTGPILLHRDLMQLPLLAGRFLVTARLHPTPFRDYEIFADLGVVTGIYLVTDAKNHIRWLGQASRNGGLVARLGEHSGDPRKLSVFATVRVLHLQDHTPPDTLDAIEGRCADQLRLRGVMPPLRWPRADNWLRLVS